MSLPTWPIEFLRGFEFRSTSKWFLLSTAVGVVAGIGAIVFQTLTQAVAHFTVVTVAGFAPDEAAGEYLMFEHAPTTLSLGWLVAIMVLGGLASGCLVYTFAPEAEGHGTDAAIDAFHNQRGIIRTRIPLIKTLASAITVGTGGSGGREGPIAQIGAAFGSYLGTRLQLSTRDRRILLAAGVGAGVGAIFRAPLAGALFAGEILYKEADLESDAIVPAAIASIVGYSTLGLSLPPDIRFTPLFGSELQYSLGSVFQLAPLSLLAVVLVIVAILYIKCFYATQAVFHALPIKPHFCPAIGAAAAALIAWGLYHTLDNEHVLSVLGTGYGSLQRAFAPTPDSGGRLGIQILLIIALFKIVTTSLTIGSGGSGGVFGPSIVIGGCLGAAVGQALQHLGIVDQPQIYGIVGMAGFFAGCAHAPFSTILMVSEITGDYKLLLPTMWVSTLCFLLCRRWTLYQKQVPSRLESPAHRGDFIIDILEGIQVRDVYDPGRNIETVPESMSLDGIVHMLAESTQHYFPVVDAEEHMVGIFSEDDVRSWLYDETIWQLAVARDVMVTEIVSVKPQDDMNVALQNFTRLNIDELPVIDAGEPHRLLGFLRRKDAIAFYNRRLMEYKQPSTY